MVDNKAGARRQADQALVATPQSPQAVSILERENEALRQELGATVDALVKLREEASGGRDEIVAYLVKVPAQRGWHRWKKKAYYRLEDEAREAAKAAAASHSKARIVERRCLVREQVIDTIIAPEPAKPPSGDPQ